MNSTLIPRDTLMSSLLAKSAAAAEASAAQEAIQTADAHLQNAALPTYSELLEALQRLTVCYDRHSATGRRHEAPAVHASALLQRHEAAISR